MGETCRTGPVFQLSGGALAAVKCLWVKLCGPRVQERLWVTVNHAFQVWTRSPESGRHGPEFTSRALGLVPGAQQGRAHWHPAITSLHLQPPMELWSRDKGTTTVCSTVGFPSVTFLQRPDPPSALWVAQAFCIHSLPLLCWPHQRTSGKEMPSG